LLLVQEQLPEKKVLLLPQVDLLKEQESAILV
jgi:hypothetical protein